MTDADKRFKEYFNDYPFLPTLFHKNHVVHRAIMEAAHKGLDPKGMLQEVMEKQSAYVEEFIRMKMMESNPIFIAKS